MKSLLQAQAASVSLQDVCEMVRGITLQPPLNFIVENHVHCFVMAIAKEKNVPFLF